MMSKYCVYFDYTGAGRGPECVAGPFSSKQEANQWLKDENHEDDSDYFVDKERGVTESYAPMELLKEMLSLDEAKKVPLKKAARSVYHRDYLKTKNKPYRKYDSRKHEKSEGA